jgi:hypothetical protein
VTILHCPFCEQTSSRNWNLKVHIRRIHGLERKRSSEIQRKIVPSSRRIHSDKTAYTRPLFRLPYYSHTSAQNSRNQMDDSHFDPNDLMHGIVEWMKTIVEFKKNAEFIFGSTKPSSNFLPSPFHFGLTDQSAAPYMAPEVRIPFGFRTRLCTRCLENTIIIVRFDREVNGHTCNASVNKSWTIKDNFETVKKLSEHSGDLLFHTVSRFQNPTFDLLHADALKGDSLETREIVAPNPLNPEQKISMFSENERKITIDLDQILHENKGTFNDSWLKTLVQEGWAELEKSDLYSYLQLVKTATFAFFRIKYEDRIRLYFISLIGH